MSSLKNRGLYIHIEQMTKTLFVTLTSIGGEDMAGKEVHITNATIYNHNQSTRLPYGRVKSKGLLYGRVCSLSLAYYM